MLISEEEMKKAIVEALADDYAKRILDSTLLKAKSVPEIMRECNVPMTSAYRRVKMLHDAGLLSVEKTITTEEGSKYELYRSSVREILVKYARGEIEIDVTPNADAAGRMADLFFSMKGEK